MQHDTTDAQARLRYLADMLQQLRIVASSQPAPLLAYLIDMARLEAVRATERLDADGQASSETRPPE